jgi:hypothetical protein
MVRKIKMAPGAILMGALECLYINSCHGIGVWNRGEPRRTVLLLSNLASMSHYKSNVYRRRSHDYSHFSEQG